MEENERIKLVLDEYATLVKTVKVAIAEKSVLYSLIYLKDIERIKSIEGISKCPKVEIFQQTDIKHLFNECLRTLWRPAEYKFYSKLYGEGKYSEVIVIHFDIDTSLLKKIDTNKLAYSMTKEIIDFLFPVIGEEYIKKTLEDIIVN